MPDFYQHARLPTLHHLADSDLIAREAELAEWAKTRPIALLLPALFSEFKHTALPRMLREIAGVPYVSEVVISVNQANAEQMEFARGLCATLLGDKPFSLLWNDGPALQAVHGELEALGCPPYIHGKGSNIWTGVAYLRARGEHQIVASHDTDILSYERGMLWRLCYPVAHPRMAYRFAKGYYGRVGERLYGRMTRLMIFPLIQTLIEVSGRSAILDHLESFRYPLSGEFCADLGTLAQLSMPSGWGLEMCLLCETYRHLQPAQMCQVDLGSNFEHRHRSVSNASAEAAVAEGLIDSAIEVSRTLAGHVLRNVPPKQMQTMLDQVQERYSQVACQWVPRFEHDALFNGLRYDVEDEHRAVQVFAQALKQAFSAEADSQHQHSCIERPASGPLLRQHADLRQALVAAAIR
jgi:glucosyl-3-phosphoglycerate synthase